MEQSGKSVNPISGNPVYSNQNTLNLMQQPRPITDDTEYVALLDWVDYWLDINPATDTKEGRELQRALGYIQQYEDLHYPIPSSQ